MFTSNEYQNVESFKAGRTTRWEDQRSWQRDNRSTAWDGQHHANATAHRDPTGQVTSVRMITEYGDLVQHWGMLSRFTAWRGMSQQHEQNGIWPWSLRSEPTPTGDFFFFSRMKQQISRICSLIKCYRLGGTNKKLQSYDTIFLACSKSFLRIEHGSLKNLKYFPMISVFFTILLF